MCDMRCRCWVQKQPKGWIWHLCDDVSPLGRRGMPREAVIILHLWPQVLTASDGDRISLDTKRVPPCSQID